MGSTSFLSLYFISIYIVFVVGAGEKWTRNARAVFVRVLRDGSRRTREQQRHAGIVDPKRRDNLLTRAR